MNANHSGWKFRELEKNIKVAVSPKSCLVCFATLQHASCLVAWRERNVFSGCETAIGGWCRGRAVRDRLSWAIRWSVGDVATRRGCGASHPFWLSATAPVSRRSPWVSRRRSAASVSSRPIRVRRSPVAFSFRLLLTVKLGNGEQLESRIVFSIIRISKRVLLDLAMTEEVRSSAIALSIGKPTSF